MITSAIHRWESHMAVVVGKLLSTYPVPTHTQKYTYTGLSPSPVPTYSPYIITWLQEPISQSQPEAAVRWLDRETLAGWWGYTCSCSDNSSVSIPFALSLSFSLLYNLQIQFHPCFHAKLLDPKVWWICVCCSQHIDMLEPAIEPYLICLTENLSHQWTQHMYACSQTEG